MLVKVIGDDAFGTAGPELDADGLNDALGNLGDVAKEKTEIWRPERETFGDIQDGWHYTKRPIHRMDTRVHVGNQLNFPPIMMLLGLPDKFHTIPDRGTDPVFARKVANQSISFSRATARFPSATEEETRFCERFLHGFLWNSGFYAIIPNLSYTVLYSTAAGVEYIDRMIEREYHSVISIPVRFERFPEEIRTDTPFTSKMTRSLKLAVDLEYGFSEKRYSKRLCREVEQELRDIQDGRFTAAYEITLYDTCPDWLLHLIREDHSEPEVVTLEDDSM
jgi:hypothetical protein